MMSQDINDPDRAYQAKGLRHGRKRGNKRRSEFTTANKTEET